MSLLRQLLQLVIVVVIALAGGLFTAAVADTWLLALLLGLATAGAALAGYILAVRLTEHRPLTELARTDASPGLGLGALLGVSMITATIVVIALLGGYHVHGIGSPTAALAVVGIMAAAAVSEELIVRGLLLRMIEQRAGTWVALLVTAPLFGAMHLFTPESTVWGAVAITLEAGGLLAAAYLATRSLWFPIGLHAGWNIAQVAIFGAVSSGSTTPQGILEATTTGPVLLSGGAFGPEASAAAVLIGLVVTIILLVVARRRGHWVPLRRREEQASQSSQTQYALAP